jgi:hypothetical protein
MRRAVLLPLAVALTAGSLPIALPLLLAGCEDERPPQPHNVVELSGRPWVERIDDPARGVACYVYRGENIHCVVLPLKGHEP